MAEYELVYDEEHGYCVLKVFGEVTPKESLGQRSAAIDFCDTQHCCFLLVDMKQAVCSQSYNELESFEFAENVDAFQLLESPCHLHYAQILPSDEHTRELVKFADIVASNRGIRCASFTVESEAIEWLLGEKQKLDIKIVDSPTIPNPNKSRCR